MAKNHDGLERYANQVMDKAQEISEFARTFREMFDIINAKLDRIEKRLDKLQNPDRNP